MDKIKFFTTEFCTNCQRLKTIINNNEQLKDKFEFIDVEQNPEYAEKYNLVCVPAVLTKDDNIEYASDFQESDLLNLCKE